ncbi:hypothetical protein B0H11DRAFT_2189130 [Mycena galericulata]|nr:hypothetical protein B0H11DRAFT_2189130 [Mycena galericulata]
MNVLFSTFSRCRWRAPQCLWAGDEPAGLAAGWEEKQKTQCMTNPTTCEPNTTKLRQMLSTTPQSPPSKKCPREARDEARPRAIQLSKRISLTVRNPPIWKRRDCRMEKSFEDRFGIADRCESDKKDELVGGEFHHQALTLVICLWPPSNVKNFCKSQDTVGDLASTRQGELGMHRTIGCVGGECGVINDGVDHRKGAFRERAWKRGPGSALGKEALIPASDGMPRTKRDLRGRIVDSSNKDEGKQSTGLTAAARTRALSSVASRLSRAISFPTERFSVARDIADRPVRDGSRGTA